MLIATENFVAEVYQQMRLMGGKAVRLLVVPHPIASRSKSEMVELGRRCAAAAVDLLKAPGERRIQL